MKKLNLMLIFISISSCCINPVTYHKFGRYNLKIDCDKVVIDNKEYKVTTHNGTQLALDGHTIDRGIQRKYRPWTYVHDIDLVNKRIDITFDSGLKSRYPIYVGNHSSIFSVYDHPWDIHKSTSALFNNNRWLLIHKFEADGVKMDLLENYGSETEWELLKKDIKISSNGQNELIPEINTKVRLLNYNPLNKTGTIQFIKNN